VWTRHVAGAAWLGLQYEKETTQAVIRLIHNLQTRVSGRGLQIALGILWLLDGALQFQRQMFTSSFANSVIAPAGQGQPAIVSWPVHLEVQVILLHPGAFDLMFGLIQLALGVGILWPRTTRYALYGSVFWGLGVWYMGEGLGGILGLHATLLTGAPGAALLYVVLALAILTRSDDRPASWLRYVWAIVWLGGALFQLLAGQNTTGDLAAMIYGSAGGAPGWIASLDLHAASLLVGTHAPAALPAAMHMQAAQMAKMNITSGPASPRSSAIIFALAAAQALIGLGGLAGGMLRKIAIWGGVALSLAFWAVGQNFGMLYSGTATDPNTGPLIILLGLAILSGGSAKLKQASIRPTKMLVRLENLLT
jgi:hypothetical protein